MLHGIINEQENCLHVRYYISEKKKLTIFHMFSYKSITSGALILEIIVIAETSPWTCVALACNSLLHMLPHQIKNK